MASFFWMKLHHDRLDDPRVVRLSDRLWRRYHELELVASKTRRDTHLGRLPPVQEIAWHLRYLTAEEIEADLVELTKSRLVENRGGWWFIKNFDRLQGAASASDRGRTYRQRQRYAESLEEQTGDERPENDPFADLESESEATRRA